MNTRGAKVKKFHPRKLIPGLRFGTLVILDFLEWRRKAFPYYRCQCDCGRIMQVNGYNLTSWSYIGKYSSYSFWKDLGAC